MEDIVAACESQEGQRGVVLNDLHTIERTPIC